MAQEAGGPLAALRALEAVIGDQRDQLEIVAVGDRESRQVIEELRQRESPLGGPVRLYVVARLAAGLPRLGEAAAVSPGAYDMRGLGQEQAAPLYGVPGQLAGRPPRGFGDAVHEAVVSYASALATVTPGSEAEGAGAVAVAEGVLAGYAARLAGDASTARPAGRAFHDLVKRVVSELRVERDEPVFRTETKPVYRREPVFTERSETDYSRPITRSIVTTRRAAPRGLAEIIASAGNWRRGRRFGVYRQGRETETTGYHSRWVSEITGYRDVLDHTESYQVRTGTRKVVTGYRPFGRKGTALGLTAWYLMLRRTAGRPAGAAAVYREILATVAAAERAGGPPGPAWLPADAGQLLDASITAGRLSMRSHRTTGPPRQGRLIASASPSH